jgi:hypothetical protein
MNPSGASPYLGESSQRSIIADDAIEQLTMAMMARREPDSIVLPPLPPSVNQENWRAMVVRLLIGFCGNEIAP